MTGAPGNDKLSEIAMQAERDLNSYRSKTGSGRDRATDYEAAGVSDVDTSKFPGASVKYGDDYVSSKSYNRRIPPDEGGDIDDHGRFIHGHAYEGIGGPEDKMAHIYQHNPGGIDESIIKKWGKDPRKLEEEMIDKTRSSLVPQESQSSIEAEPPHVGEPMERGRSAGRSNLGIPPSNHGELPSQRRKRSVYKGSERYNPDMVPDSHSEQSALPPKSVIETSKRAGGA